jgi:hypothetical protein
MGYSVLQNLSGSERGLKTPSAIYPSRRMYEHPGGGVCMR